MDDAANKAPPTWLLDALDRSEAQIVAGQSVTLEPVLDRVRASIGRAGMAEPAPAEGISMVFERFGRPERVEIASGRRKRM